MQVASKRSRLARTRQTLGFPESQPRRLRPIASSDAIVSADLFTNTQPDGCINAAHTAQLGGENRRATFSSGTDRAERGPAPPGPSR